MADNQLPQLPSASTASSHSGDSEFAPLSIAEILAIYKRWYKLAIFTFAGLLIPATVVIFLILPLYEGKGSVLVDRDSPNVNFSVESTPGATTTFRNVNREEEISTRAELFKAREIAERVVADLDLTMEKLNNIRDARRYVQMIIDGVIDTARAIYDGLKNLLGLGIPLTEEEKAELAHIRLVDEVIDRIQVNPVSESNILLVTFRSSDPVLARDMVNALLDEFLAFYGAIGDDRAEKFFVESTERLKGELEQAENQILKLQVETSNFMSAEQEGSLVMHYEQTKEKLRHLKIQEARLRSQLASFRDHVKTSSNSVGLRQQMQAGLMSTETELAALLEEKRSTAEVLDEYGADLDRISAVNLQLKDLERRARLLEESYEMNMRNLEKARVGQAMSGASMSSVRVVSYAPYPLKTVRPRKLLYLVIAFVASLIVGLAMPFLAYLNDSTIASEDDVRKHLGLEFVGLFPQYNKNLFGKS
jgi:uncharacterized protein involved in exopolysaccharide biosynthesis